MTETNTLIATVLLLFGGSMIISYCVTWYLSSRAHHVKLAANIPVRLIGEGGTYRCHFLRSEGNMLIFSSPLQQDRYVPLRSGEKLLVHAPGDGHFLAFRSEFVSFSDESHEMFLMTPSYVRRVDRRAEERTTEHAGEDAMLNGEIGTIVDLSANGACILVNKHPHPGARAFLSLQYASSHALGWVLDATPSTSGDRMGYRVRIRFVKPLSGLTAANN